MDRPALGLCGARQSRAARPSLTPRWGTHVVPQTLPRLPIGAPTPTGPRLRRPLSGDASVHTRPHHPKPPPCMGVTSQIRRDGGADVVAWLPFEDEKHGCLSLLCQCTVEIDWPQKAQDITNLWLKWIDFGTLPVKVLA